MPVARVIVTVFVISAVCAAIASILYTARLETGRPTLGAGNFLLDVIGATVIGGTSLFGGKGKIIWTFFGVLFFVLLSNTLNLMNLSAFHIDMVKGAVILMAALLDVVRTRLLQGGDMTALLAFDSLAKDWFGVPAVRDVTLAIDEGTTLGLIGENGAGKSTLMNMIGGVVAPSSGAMFWRGEPYAPASAADATARGIAFIHQELNLFTNLSIAENIFIDGFPRRYGLIDRSAIAETTRALLARLDLEHAPETIVGELAPGERQLVEIAKALHRAGRPHHLRRADDLADAAGDGAALRRDRAAQGRGADGHLHQPHPRRRARGSATGSRCCATAGWSTRARRATCRSAG